MSDLIGFQERVQWLGTEVLTLAEVWPEVPRAMIVGLNPAPSSVAAGHYYQGRVGRRQLLRLVEAGLMKDPEGPNFEMVASAAGIGFTDLVRRPTVGEGDVDPSELAHGRASRIASLAERDVPLVICVFRHPVKALLGTDGAPGYQDALTSWGAKVFRMPGPMQKREESATVMNTLRLG
jgi:TDG/mug DNA glycosylase family protein